MPSFTLVRNSSERRMMPAVGQGDNALRVRCHPPGRPRLIPRSKLWGVLLASLSVPFRSLEGLRDAAQQVEGQGDDGGALLASHLDQGLEIPEL
jgi:hypothetical protein